MTRRKTRRWESLQEGREGEEAGLEIGRILSILCGMVLSLITLIIGLVPVIAAGTGFILVHTAPDGMQGLGHAIMAMFLILGTPCWAPFTSALGIGLGLWARRRGKHVSMARVGILLNIVVLVLSVSFVIYADKWKADQKRERAARHAVRDSARAATKRGILQEAGVAPASP